MKFLGVQVLWGHAKICLLRERTVVAAGSSYNQEKDRMFSRLFWFLEDTQLLTWAFCSNPIYRVTQKVTSFKWGPEQQNAYNRSMLPGKLF